MINDAMQLKIIFIIRYITLFYCTVCIVYTYSVLCFCADNNIYYSTLNSTNKSRLDLQY